MQKVTRNFRWALALGATGLVTCSLERTSSAMDNVPPKPPVQAEEAQKTGFMPFVLVGGTVRLDDAPQFPITERVGGNFGIGFLYQIKAVSFGLSYEYAGLGEEDSGVGPYGFVQIRRSIDSVLASLKVNFSGLSWATPYVGVAVGGTWQDATMNGVVFPDGGVSGGVPFTCSSSDTISLALRLGTGLAIPLSPKVSFLTDASFDAYQLSSDIVQYCAPGAGSTSNFLFRVGLSYHFDMAEGSKPPRRPTARR